MSTAAAHADPAALQQENALLRGENKALRDQLAWLKQKVFGPGRSETLDRAQQLIALAAATAPAPERSVETITYRREKGPRAARPTPAETFAHLPVKETIVIIPDEAKAQPEAFEQIGEERTFEVDLIAPQLFKREIVRPKFRRKADRSQPPVLAPSPLRPVVGGYASAGLLAWIIVAKFVDHLPLYRQEKMLTRWGARISRQSLGDWVALVFLTVHHPRRTGTRSFRNCRFCHRITAGELERKVVRLDGRQPRRSSALEGRPRTGRPRRAGLLRRELETVRGFRSEPRARLIHEPESRSRSLP